jgi:subtilisin family serine protease
MKVIVKDFLNVRVGAPSVNAPCYQYLAPGSEIEVDGKFYHGDIFDNSDVWLKDLAGNYYWRGGVTGFEDLTINTPKAASTELILKSKIQLANAMPAHDGENIQIAILDSGVDVNHPALANATIEKKDFLSDVDEQKKNTNPHGTLVAGIIANSDSVIEGLAVKSKIRDYRVIQSDGFVDSLALVNALQHIIDNNINIDIVNMSLNIDSDLVPHIQERIDTLVPKGCIFVVAGGTATSPNSITELKKVIFVSVFNQANNPKTKSIYNASFLNTTIKSTGITTIKPHDDFSGDSAYTALMTGLIARFLSSTNFNKEDRLKKVEDFLSLNSFSEKNASINSFKPLKA